MLSIGCYINHVHHKLLHMISMLTTRGKPDNGTATQFSCPPRLLCEIDLIKLNIGCFSLKS